MVVEGCEGFGGVAGGGDAFYDGLHDFVGGVVVDFGVKGGDAAKGGLGVGVAGALVDGLEALVAGPDGDAGGVAVFHDGTGGAIEEFEDAEGVVDVFEVGLAESGFACLEDLVGAEDGVAIGGAVEGGGLVGVGAVAEVFDFGVGAADDFDGVGEVAEGLGAVHRFEVLGVGH